MAKFACPKCKGKKLYQLGSGKRRCSRCLYEFTPHKLPLRFTRKEWREILHLFLMEQSSNSIAEQTGHDKRRILRALTRVRTVLATDVPEVFTGTVEVDETYLGGAWRNKRKVVRDTGTKRGRGTSNNQYLAFSAEMGRNGPRSLITLKREHSSLSSPSRYNRDRSSVLIPGKPILV